jgi:hypothetical protein
MVKLHPQGIELLLDSAHAHESFLENSICCVSFSFSPKFCAFLGYVIDVLGAKTADCRLVVSVPPQLMAANLRKSFRVPVIKNSGLQTAIRKSDETRFVVTTHDIAVAGIEVEFNPSDHPGLKVGMFVDVELRFREETVEKRGEIRRISGLVYGLAFTCPPGQQEQNHDARLNGIVISLQQLWLKSRIK